MNLLKNLMILAVLAAVGYGVYASLSPNGVDATSSFDAPRVDLSSTKPSLTPGGPLPLGGNSARDSGATGLGVAPLTPPPLVGSPPLGATNTPAMPYPAPNASTVTPLSPPGVSSNSPTATLGAPMSPDAMSALTMPKAGTGTQGVPALPMGAQTPPSPGVRNLSPPPEVVAAGGSASVADETLRSEFAGIMVAVQEKLDQGKLAEAQLALSVLYMDRYLPADQAKQVTELLDQLAGTVIYSRKSFLEPPYAVQPGDTIERVAQQYKVPWQLLARINGLMPPGAPNTDETVRDQPLPVGKELKVVRGPFDAVVQLDKRQLTLMVQNRYAGRFSIGVGRDLPKLDGQYTIGEKKLNPTYYGPDGTTVNPSDPKNPLGSAWIGLTDRIGIHGAADPQCVGRDDNRGTICVGDRDLQDLFGILSVGSRVTIVR